MSHIVPPIGGASEKIHALTSLRFFAALYVVSYHTVFLFFSGLTEQSLPGRFFDDGFISVSFFFLLSGYILGLVYLKRERGVPLQSFFLARFARIYPLFFLTLILDFPFYFQGSIASIGLKQTILKSPVVFAANGLMIQAWLQRLRGIDNPNWSLSVEALFYLTFPWLGVALWKLRGMRLWLAGIAVYLGGQGLVLLASPHTSVASRKFFPVFHLSTFALGILLARWQVLARAVKGSRQPSDLSLYVATVAAMLVFASEAYWSSSSTSFLYFNVYDGLLAPVFIVVIWAFSHSQWFPARLLSAPWLVVLGEASFGLYLIHLVIYHLFEWRKWTGNPAYFVIYLAVCIGLSIVSFYWFETPMRRWILKRGHRPGKETLEAASIAQ